MSTATAAEGVATSATARNINPTQALTNSLVLFAAARREQKAINERVASMQAELVELLEADYDGSMHVQQGTIDAHFTVVRSHDNIEHHNDDLVMRVGKKLRMLKRFTKTVIDWTAVRAAVDSGIFPELSGAVVIEARPKNPYIKIS